MITFTRPEVWHPAFLSLLITAVLTPFVAWIARRTGMVASPKKDRWHSRPTALLGGVAIFVSVVTVVLLRVDVPHAFSRAILPAAALLFFLGLVDDIVNLKPYQKLVMQIIAASIVVHAGLVLPWTSSLAVNSMITLFWLVGITNAVNMLDNMDGLAAGVAAIACFFLAINFFSLGQIVEGTVIAVLAASLCGFLFYNSQPASIFMGDCGSMFIGFFLAGTALLTTTSGRTRSFFPVIAVPVLTLLIPIFDTTFVTLLRKLSGRAASQGGRDHTSHRLVALGLSERRAVWLLYALAAISGFLSTQVRHLQLNESVMAILGFTIVLTLVGAYLADVKVYPADADLSNRPIMSFLLDMSYKRRVFETLMDAGLIVIAYYAAWSLRFGRMQPTDPNAEIMIRALPMVIAVKTGVFLMSGVYRGLWRYTSVHDLIGIARSVLLASAASTMAVLFAFPQFGFRTRFFLLDMLLLLMLVTASRMAFRIARRLLTGPRVNAGGRPVVIYGAGDAGELLLREIFNNPDLGYQAVAIIDDDPKKVSKVVHGLKVYSGNALREVCESFGVQEVLISTSKLSDARRRAVIEECDRIGIPLRQMRIELTPLNSWERDPLAHREEMPASAQPRIPVRGHGSTYVVGDQLDPATMIRPQPG
jgi:UDP-GlcNAc:undecaprenyl-phosphate GlcNAc-1-phosphate transferase